MKNLISSIVFITLLNLLTSCTAEEMQAGSTTENHITILAKYGDIDPPVNIPPKPTRP